MPKREADPAAIHVLEDIGLAEPSVCAPKTRRDSELSHGLWGRNEGLSLALGRYQSLID